MKTTFSIRITAVLGLCLTVLAVPAPAADCNDWNSRDYFQAAAPENVADCLRSGAELEARNKYGRTPLHHAVWFNGNPAVAAALLDAGADPKALDKYDRTPLHGAAMANRNPVVIALLLEAGADPVARDRFGRTPWDHAMDRGPLKGSDIYWRLQTAPPGPGRSANGPKTAQD